ncbi:MAG TPA: choice-of-anchor tandem repeat GloVer-containing protein [Verrucomicrobiae bacterium]|nr:choice-of-anchor tandem repeat GloVer-containing protein [Verrucomicrobiae bacterium]
MMKVRIKNLLLLPVLTTSLMLANQAKAQSLTTLYSFSNLSSNTNSDGAYPSATLIMIGNTLFGTTQSGGTSGKGTVFSVNTDGTSFTNLHNFAGSPYDGANPLAGLTMSGNTIYGATCSGGGENWGMIFSINTDGTGLTNLYSFSFPIYNGYTDTNRDGYFPNGLLLLSSNMLYGAARFGGIFGNGTLFKVSTNGTDFTLLHTFTANPSPSYTNSDGSHPYGSLILSGNTLYGTTIQGGNWGGGAVFAINIDGTGFTNLHSFTALSGSWPNQYNSDGSGSAAGLILSGNTLYGTASYGGSSNSGAIFAINTDGTGFTNLYSFTANPDPYYTNSDGAHPEAELILSGNTLLGTTQSGGSSGDGTVFAINIDGTDFINLHSFTGLEGSSPQGGLRLSGNTVYGTTFGGGASDYGVVFSISFAPQLAITPSGTNMILSWPTNVAGFDYSGFALQSTADLTSPAAWSSVTNVQVVAAGQNTVTNPLTGTQQFYRLAQ